MKNNIEKIMKELKKLAEEDFDYSEFELATYLFMRAGEDVLENLDEDDLEKLYDKLQNIDGSIFNEDLNDYANSNFDI